MLYNNPPAYRVNIEIETLERLAEHRNIVAIKESAPDPRRFTDLLNALGERYVLFAGLDDVVFEALTLGARGWVSGRSRRDRKSTGLTPVTVPTRMPSSA